MSVSDTQEPIIKHRTFDPESRTLKKHGPTDDVEMEDTVEKKVEGLAEAIIAEDAERRAQDLVSTSFRWFGMLNSTPYTGFV